MIIDKNSQTMTTDIPESPPAYDVATSAPPENSDIQKAVTDVKDPATHVDTTTSVVITGPYYTRQPGYFQAPVVHHYINPITGEHVTSLLPPDHPEMVCLQAGMHVPHTNYGILGILAAIFWFPLGVGLCLLDRRVKCERCGTLLNDGLCG